MLNEIIEQFRKNKLLFNEEYSKKDLMEAIQRHIKENKDLLEESYQYEYGESIDLERVLDIFHYIEENPIGNIKSPYKNTYGLVSNNYVPYGVVGVVIKNDISLYNTASIINLLIQTNNSLIMEPFRKMGTVNILVELLNQVITQIKGVNKIIVNTSHEELQRNPLLDLLVFIGRKEEFSKIDTKVEKKYFGIGNYELVIDKEIDSHLVEEARRQGVMVVNKNTEKDFYSKFNDTSSNYCTSIMTDSKESAREFLLNMKSSNVMVNVLPTLHKEINISIMDFIYKKSTLIFEENKNLI